MLTLLITRHKRRTVGSNPYSSSLGVFNASFAFSYVTPQDVFNAINEIKSNSMGLDGI
jgi:hypothetical protein